MVRFVSCIVIFAILSPLIIADPCRFQDSTNGVIDISSLGHTDGTAAFKDFVPSGAPNYKFSYNPCKPFSEGASCIDVAACQVSMDGTFTFIIGKQDTAKLDVTGPNPTIVYTADIRTTKVELVCSTDSTNSIEALGENPPATYTFRLTSKSSCWVKGSSGGGSGGIPAGVVFIIIPVAFFLRLLCFGF